MMISSTDAASSRRPFHHLVNYIFHHSVLLSFPGMTIKIIFICLKLSLALMEGW